MKTAAAVWIFGLLTLDALHAANAPKKEALPAPDVRDARYGPHERHTVDLWITKASKPAPLVVFIHGGGWNGGDKSGVPAELLALLRSREFSVASINYRYTSIAKAPGPLHDAARAVQFLRSQAHAWKLDAARIGAYGVSAGGCSALWLAYHDDLADPSSSDPVMRKSSRVQVAVGISAQVSLEPDVVVAWVGQEVMNHLMIRRAVGARTLAEVPVRDAELGGVLRESSPIRHVSKGDAPVLLVFPTMAALPATSPGSAIHHALFGVKLQAAARAAGLVCELRIEDASPPDAPTVESFFSEHLTSR